ncbi:hypothetical protein BH24ACI1_BH24ACI1_24670 [soil metagenome]
MKEKKDSFSDERSEREKIEDAIFGNEDGFDEELAKETVGSYGLSAESLVEKLKSKMQEKVRERYRNNDNNIDNLNQAIRSITNYQKRSLEKTEPDNWIPGILAGAMGNNSQIARAHRPKNSEEPSANDKSILDGMEDKAKKE